MKAASAGIDHLEYPLKDLMKGLTPKNAKELLIQLGHLYEVKLVDNNLVISYSNNPWLAKLGEIKDNPLYGKNPYHVTRR